jgi:hypothetical protein
VPAAGKPAYGATWMRLRGSVGPTDEFRPVVPQPVDPSLQRRCLTRTEHLREHDHHLFGVFPDATWRRLIDDSGLELVDVDVDDPDADEHVVFVGRRPPAERQIKAG